MDYKKYIAVVFFTKKNQRWKPGVLEKRKNQRISETRRDATDRKTKEWKSFVDPTPRRIINIFHMLYQLFFCRELQKCFSIIIYISKIVDFSGKWIININAASRRGNGLKNSPILQFFNFTVASCRKFDFHSGTDCDVTDFVIPRKETLVATLSKTACLGLTHSYIFKI